jgi:hypothetical protein
MSSPRIVLAALLALAACATDAADPPGGGADAAPADTIGSGYVADYATSEDFFTRTPDYVQLPGSPHGQVRIWYSAALEPFIDQAAFTAPAGTTSIKQADRSGDGAPDTIYVMTKQPPGYDPGNGDWYYEVRSGDGETVSSSGAIGGCIGCHALYADTDYLAGTAITSP